MNSKEFKEIDKKFNASVKNDKLDINMIEDMMLTSIDDYKKRLKGHIEDLLVNNINEKDLIRKKNKNGKKKDIN